MSELTEAERRAVGKVISSRVKTLDNYLSDPVQHSANRDIAENERRVLSNSFLKLCTP